MPPVNSVTVVGNATRDPELRFTPGGKAVASFGVAFNKRRRTASGDWEDGDAAFFDVTCWDQLAENVSASIQKGTRVLVTGRLDYRSWESDGKKQSKVEIIADEVAPSLRWATATVERTDRREGGGGGGGFDRAPMPTEPPAGYDDEEPF
jgi:single-strand DNA-binding protein